MADRRPFHETIVDAIGQMTPVHMPLIARLIMATRIPRGHQEIIDAWEAQRVCLEREGFSVKGNPQSLYDDLNKQKSEAEAEDQRKLKAELNEIIEDAREDCN